MTSRKAQALEALGKALEAANEAGDVALAGSLATAFYWASGATNIHLDVPEI